MPTSPNFIRIKGQILHIVQQIPPGRLATHAAIGAALEVPGRHVAYILATLEENERAIHPWHRVLAAGGKLGAHKRVADQRARLQEEGIVFGAGGAVAAFAAREISIDPAWVIGTTRPA